MSEPILCETIGFELEVENVSNRRIKIPKNFQTTGDASVESDGLTTQFGVPVDIHGDFRGLNLSKTTFGTEILSDIINTNEDYLYILKELCHNLTSMGEPEQSNRAGLHVHLSYAKNSIALMKSVLRLGAHLEDFFFLLGGMGYAFRGIENDATYCRPITKYGPQIVQSVDGSLHPCFVLSDLYESKDFKDFSIRLGSLNELSSNRYIPIRYTWLNLFNLFNSKGTLEFRVFNKSLNPLYLFTAIEISKYFGQCALSEAFNEKPREEHSVFDWRDKSDITKTFIDWSNEIRIPTYISDIALEIVDKVPIESIRLPKNWVYSHLRFHRGGDRCPIHWTNVDYVPSIQVSEREVKRPKFLDIHNLRAQENLPELVREPDPRIMPITGDPRMSRARPSNTTIVPNSSDDIRLPIFESVGEARTYLGDTFSQSSSSSVRNRLHDLYARLNGWVENNHIPDSTRIVYNRVRERWEIFEESTSPTIIMRANSTSLNERIREMGEILRNQSNYIRVSGAEEEIQFDNEDIDEEDEEEE